MRARRVLLAALAVAAGMPAVAAAHVDVLPREVVQGEAVEFTIRVPTERDTSTIAVRVDFPPQVTVFSLAPPPPGFRMTPRRAPDGRLSGVVYRGRIPVGGYQDFTLLGTPFDAGDSAWRALQTYADGAVKPWTEPPQAEGEETQETGPTDPGPAALVRILPEGSAPSAPAAAAASGEDDGSDAAVWLGVIAVAFSALALLGTGFLWTTRPMTLPEDESPPGPGGA